MQRDFKRFLSVLMAVIMLVGGMNLTALASLPEMELDTALKVVPGEGTVQVTFTPDSTGYYVFSSEAISDADPCLNEISDGETTVNIVAGEFDDYEGGLDFYAVYELEADKQYTIVLSDYVFAEDGYNVVVSISDYTPGEGDGDEADTIDVGELEIDVPKLVKPESNISVATFVPESTGEYVISSQAVTEADPYIEAVYDSDGYYIENKLGALDDYSGRDFYAVYNFEAGEEYEIHLRDYASTEDGYNVLVSKFEYEIDGEIGLDTSVAVIGKGIYSFTPEEEGYYQIYSKGTDNTDTSLDVLNKVVDNEEYIDNYNDFWCSYYLEANEEYVFLFNDISNSGDEFDVFVEKYYTIVSEPTSNDLAVNVLWKEEVKGYQWYNVNYKSDKITDEEEQLYVSSTEKTVYDENNDIWTSTNVAQGTFYLFTLDVKRDDKYYIEILSEDVNVGYIFLQGNKEIYFEQYEEGKWYCTIDRDMEANLLLGDVDSDEIQFRVVRATCTMGEMVDGETSNVFTGGIGGSYYKCCVTYTNGDTVVSLPVLQPYMINHHPSDSERYVSLNSNENVSFKWYEMKEDVSKVSLDNADVTSLGGESSTYDEENGVWIPAYFDGQDGGYIGLFFDIELSKGEIIEVEFSGDITECALRVGGSDREAGCVVNGNKAVFTALESETYILSARFDSDDFTAEATVIKYVTDKLIESETTNTLTKYEAGKMYACVITCEDGTVLTSDSFMALSTKTDVVYGDANNDAKINVMDAVMIKKHIAGFENLEINLDNADVNVDTRINVMDAVMLLKYIAGFDVVLGE